jgi:hypothetical protein
MARLCIRGDRFRANTGHLNGDFLSRQFASNVRVFALLESADCATRQFLAPAVHVFIVTVSLMRQLPSPKG